MPDRICNWQLDLLAFKAKADLLVENDKLIYCTRGEGAKKENDHLRAMKEKVMGGG